MDFSLLAVVTLGGGLLIGFLPSLIDSLKQSWQTRLNQPSDRLDWAVRLFYFCWLPAMPSMGWILDRWQNKDVLFFGLFFGMVGLIAGLAWLGMVRSLHALLANMVLLGFAYSAVTTCSVQLMTVAFFPEELLFGERLPFAALNLGFIAVAVGALLGPVLAQLMERWWGYRQGLLYLSLSCILPAVLTVLCERDKFPPSPPTEGALADEFVHPRLLLVAVIILLYFGMESCLEFWPEPYLKELGYEARGLQWGLLIFWLAFIATRCAAAWWFYEHPGHGMGLTLILVILSALVMGNLAGGYEVGSGSWGFWLAGACYGPLLPGFLAMALDFYPLPTATLGFLLSLSGLDTLIVRPLMHTYATTRPARTVMRVPTLLALLLAAPLLILVLLRNN